MDLIAKAGLIILLIAVVAGAVLFLAQPHHATAGGPVNETQAVQTVLSDLRASHPLAQVNLISVSPSQLENGSWSIVVGLVFNATRACPTLLIEQFDYPATQLVNSTINKYTSNCIVYGLTGAPYYIISSPEIAIARASNSSTFAKDFISTFGYNETVVSAKLYAQLNSSSTPLSTLSGNNIWVVGYNATDANYTAYIALSLNGTVLGNYTLAK